MSQESAPPNAPIEFPITEADRARIARVSEKAIKFWIAGIVGTGKLVVSTYGQKARAKIQVYRSAGPSTFAVRVINLSQEQFRQIQEAPEVLLLPGED